MTGDPFFTWHFSCMPNYNTQNFLNITLLFALIKGCWVGISPCSYDTIHPHFACQLFAVMGSTVVSRWHSTVTIRVTPIGSVSKILILQWNWHMWVVQFFLHVVNFFLKNWNDMEMSPTIRHRAYTLHLHKLFSFIRIFTLNLKTFTFYYFHSWLLILKVYMLTAR